MKTYLHLLILMLLPLFVSAQFYSGFDIQTVNASKIESARGGNLNSGYSFKKFYTGIGGGVLFFNDKRPYIPVFAEIGTNSMLHASFRLGYGIYKGVGYPISSDKENINGGAYSSMKLGVSIKLNEASILIFAHDTYAYFGSTSKNFYGFGIGMNFKY